VAGEALPAVDQTMRHNPARGIMQEIDGKRRSGADHPGARSPAMIAATLCGRSDQTDYLRGEPGKGRPG